MTQTIETKMVGGSPSDDFAATFAAFRAANDERLAEIEKKSAADPLLTAKVDRLNARLESLSATMGAPVTAATSGTEVKSAWSRFIRNGDASAMNELKSLSTTDGDGGFIAPVETESRIDTVLAETSPFRSIATVRRIGSGTFRKPIAIGKPQVGWTSEEAPRAETAGPELKLVDFPVGELYAMPAATQTLLDDSVADVDAWLADEVRDVFVAQETAAFVNGDGVNKPKGFLADQGTDRALAEIAAGETVGYDALMDLIYAPRSTYRAGASFVMNRRTLASIRKLKDDTGSYIWQPGGQAGQPSTLLGYRVVEAEDMPDIGAGATPVAFGDFRRGYLIADRQGVRVLRDPYSAKPHVLFYTTKRVGGGVQDSDAIALLKTGA